MEQTDMSMAFSVIMVFMILGFVVLGLLLAIIPWWKICAKAGFPGALSLLMLVPVANLILPFYIAFADWPALRQRQG
jgi:glucan phosphoethanolaminetransferase (alkaline phosphatase superfamily)